MSFSSSAKFRVLGERGDRLTCRLEGLLRIWRFARLLERDAVVYWPPRQEASYLSSSIFDLPAMAGDPACEDLILVDEKYVPQDVVLNLEAMAEWPNRLKHDDLRRISRDFFVYGHFDVRCRGERSSRIRREKTKLNSLLRPHPEVLQDLARAIDWIGPGDFIAVHLRRGDMITGFDSVVRQQENQARRKGSVEPGQPTADDSRLENFIHNFLKRTAPVEAYLDALGYHTLFQRKKMRVIIFSDTEACAREFQERCQNHPTRLMTSFRSNLSEIQRAYLELLILSRARRIVSTGSVFGKFASNYGTAAFTDVRRFTSRKKMRLFFRQSFAPYWQTSSFLQARCERILDAGLRQSKVINFFGDLFPSNPSP